MQLEVERARRNLLAQHALCYAVSKGTLPPKRDIVFGLQQRAAKVEAAKHKARFRWTVMNPLQHGVLQQGARTFPSSTPSAPSSLHNGHPPLCNERVPSLLIHHRQRESTPRKSFAPPIGLTPPSNLGVNPPLNMSLGMFPEPMLSDSISRPPSRQGMPTDRSNASSRSTASRPNKPRCTRNIRDRRQSTSVEFMPVPAELTDYPEESSVLMVPVLVDAAPRGITTYETAPTVAPQLYVNNAPERTSDGLFVPHSMKPRKPRRGSVERGEERRKRRGSVGDAYRAGEGKSGWMYREDGTSNMGLYASKPGVAARSGPSGPRRGSVSTTKAARRSSVSRPVATTETAVIPVAPNLQRRGPTCPVPLKMSQQAHGGHRPGAFLSPILSPSLMPMDSNPPPVSLGGTAPYLL